MATHETLVRRQIQAPCSKVYAALMDARAVASWMVPKGMTSQVHTFEPHEGGAFRISLTYDAPGQAGKTSGHTDTYHGHFVRLVPNQEVVQTMEFETDDPAMRGEMTSTFRLSAAFSGTLLVARHEHVPAGVSPEDNETGWRMALDKLAELVEADED